MYTVGLGRKKALETVGFVLAEVGGWATARRSAASARSNAILKTIADGEFGWGVTSVKT